jgi:hypothetical protein
MVYLTISGVVAGAVDLGVVAVVLLVLALGTTWRLVDARFIKFILWVVVLFRNRTVVSPGRFIIMLVIIVVVLRVVVICRFGRTFASTIEKLLLFTTIPYGPV